ncbi:AsnC family protein [Priestia flexa]|uniref:AsnC family protein n=1 Tax=Priestia flexa TaxID=86664 RepID=UPI003D29E666
MSGVTVKQFEQEKLIDWTSCWFGANKKTGYVSVTDFRFQKSYGSKDIDSLIRDTLGIEKRFISLNGFTFGERQASELRQIRNIGIDLDQYKQGMSIEDGLDEIQALILDKIIPEPNLILTSRGIQLFYTIYGGASPNMAWLTSYITEQYISKLRHLGADSNAKDISRVMRVPNSINERNGELVKPEIWNPYSYTLQELQSYCKPLDRFNYKGKKRAEIKRIVPPTLSFFYKTNNARLVDLDKLIHLRNGNLSHKRNTFLYIYAYHQSLICNSLSDTEGFMLNVLERIHSEVDKPISKAEFRRTVKSAYEDAKEFFKHYQDNGYKVIARQNDGIKKPYKTTNLIEILEITTEEQRLLKRIVGEQVSKEHDATRKRKERRAAGVKSHHEHLKQRKTEQAQKVEKLRKIKSKRPGATNVELAKELNVSTKTIQRLSKLL